MKQTTEKQSARILLNVIKSHGLTHLVCSPGSRNTPLLLAAANDDELHKHLVTDERTAGFIALGLAATTQKPVGVICTSGTALLNYAPAVAEAFYRHLPLIVISADRPEEWIDQDDSQTIKQFEALANFVKRSYDIPEPNGKNIYATYTNRLINDAMIEAVSDVKGPVHINMRFDNPLGNKTLPQENPKEHRHIDAIFGNTTLPPHVTSALADELKDKKILVVAGICQADDKLNRAMLQWQSVENAYVMAENVSNLHLHGSPWLIDALLIDIKKHPELDPDIVITIGGALVSRHLKEYIRSLQGRAEHWSIGPTRTTVDCFLSLTKRIDVDPAGVMASLAHKTRKRHKREAGETSFRELWHRHVEDAKSAREHYLENIPWTEMKAHKIIYEWLPASYNLHVSNGTPVRYSQLLMTRMPHAVFCNRGVSGIEGSTSTAIGSAMAYPNPTLLISGDLSASYDIGALAVHGIPDNFKMIVINNGGGGIFRFIGTTSSLPEREEYFCVPPKLPLKHIAEGYGLEYMVADDETQLKKCLKAMALQSYKPTILEIITPQAESAEILKNYFK